MPSTTDPIPCTDWPLECDGLIALARLDKGSEFTRGTVPSAFFDKLKQLCLDPWQPAVTPGVHSCGVCQFDAPTFCFNEVYVPHQQQLWVAPVAIVHYIAAHHYRPPPAFIQAVEACPPMRIHVRHVERS